MRVLSIVGARPQFIKLKPVADAFAARGIQHLVLHTGQHYDYDMSETFFSELQLPRPDWNLGVGSGGHARQVATMLHGIAPVVRETRPDFVLVFGDTNSTLAGALAASMEGTPVAHVEAGARSYNRRMPEERNRLVADVVADLLLTASPSATENLRREHIQGQIRFVGDTMKDAVLWAGEVAARASTVLAAHGLQARSYAVATIHRAETTDDPARLEQALQLLGRLDLPVVFPLHPRTRRAIERYDLTKLLEAPSFRVLSPLGYLDMIHLVRNARVVLTDSGGLQKEAFYLRVPCVTLRRETEWPETVACGWNILVDIDPELARDAVKRPIPPVPPSDPYGDGRAGEKIATALLEFSR